MNVLFSEENERKEYVRETLERAIQSLKKSRLLTVFIGNGHITYVSVILNSDMRSADPKLSILRQQADLEVIIVLICLKF